MRKVWIEAALNGAWSPALQPGIPDTMEVIVAEGIACARAGATIIHTHAYHGGGPRTFDWQVYARIIEGIRAEVIRGIPIMERVKGQLLKALRKVDNRGADLLRSLLRCPVPATRQEYRFLKLGNKTGHCGD